MPQITSGRLALATSSLALVVAVGGVGYAAATIGTADLKKNAVTSQKIKNNNVTGKDVKESSLAKVPSATNADTAANAAKVGGIGITKVRYDSASASPTVVFNGGGLVLTASCTANDLALVATTTKQDSNFYSSALDLESDVLHTTDFESGGFDTTVNADLLGGADLSQEDPALVHFAYDAQDGSVVTGTLSTDNADGGPDKCVVAGNIIG
jgi:hypothetical protein